MLVGSHTWSIGASNCEINDATPDPMNIAGYMAFMREYGHNFTRLWFWEQMRWVAEDADNVYFEPGV